MSSGENRLAVWSAYGAMCAIWGTTWLAIKVSLNFIPPMTGVALRFIISGLVLLAVAALRGRLMPLRAMPWHLIAMLAIFLFGLNYVLAYVAETRLDSGLVAVLFGTLPFFVFFFGHHFADEPTTPRIWIGTALALAGVGVISFSGQARGAPLYALAAIGSAALAAFGNVYAKRHSEHDPLVTLPASMLVSGIGVGVFGAFFERVSWTSAIAPASIASLLYMAILGSSLAFWLNLWVLHRLPVWIVGLSSLIIPVIAVAVGIFLGGEHFTWRELGGSALVVAGIWFALSSSS